MFNSFKNYLIQYKYLFILLIISISTHLAWFDFTSTLNKGDWQFRYENHFKNSFHNWDSWLPIEQLGSPNIQINAYPLRSVLWGIMSFLGLDYNTSVKISLLIPLALFSYLGIYFYIKKITNNDYAAFVSSLVYNTNTYFLIIQTRHILLAFIYALMPIFFIMADNAICKNKPSEWIKFTLFISLLVVIELRICILIVFLFFINFIIKVHLKIYKINKYHFKNLFLCICCFFLINMYWVLPLVFNMNSGSNVLIDRGVFGNELFNLTKAITIFRWTWTGGAEAYAFDVQPILFHLWIVPSMVFISLFFTKNNYNKVYFVILCGLGIFLTKQSADPFPNSYQFLFDNVPFFNLFREASKFYIITAFSYSGLIGLFIVKYFNNKKILYLISLPLICVSLINLYPLFTKEIGGVFINRNIPYEYIEFSNFLNKSNNFERVMWVPFKSEWSFFNNNKPRVQSRQFLNENANFLNKNINSSELDKILNFFGNDIFENIIKKNNINYIVIPTEVENSKFESLYKFHIDDYYKKNKIYIKVEDVKSYINNKLEKLSFLEKVDGLSKDLIVYELKNKNSYINASYDLLFINNLEILSDNYTLIDKYLFRNNLINTNFTEDPSTISSNYFNKSVLVKPFDIDFLDKNLLTTDGLITNFEFDNTYDYMQVESNKYISIYSDDEWVEISYFDINLNKNEKEIIHFKNSKKYQYWLKLNGNLYKIDNEKKHLFVEDGDILEIYFTNNKNGTNSKFNFLNCINGENSEITNYHFNDSEKACLKTELNYPLSGDFVLSLKIKNLTSWAKVNLRTVMYLNKYNKNIEQQSFFSYDQKDEYFFHFNLGNNLNLKKLLYIENKSKNSFTLNSVEFEKMYKFKDVRVAFEKKVSIDKIKKFKYKNLYINLPTDFLVFKDDFISKRWGLGTSSCSGTIEENYSKGRGLTLDSKKQNCAMKGFSVKGGDYLLVDIDILDLKGKNNLVYIEFDDYNTTNFKSKINSNIFFQTYLIPKNAKNARLFIISNKGKEKNQILVKSVNVRHLPRSLDNLFFYKISQKNKDNINIDILEDNVTNKKISVTLKSKDGFFVSMSQKYHPQWFLYDSNNKLISKPIKSNFGTTVWFVNLKHLCEQNGCFEKENGDIVVNLKIFFEVQKYMNIGIFFSAFSLIISIVLFLFFKYNKK